jgi:hypothetical protein
MMKRSVLMRKLIICAGVFAAFSAFIFQSNVYAVDTTESVYEMNYVSLGAGFLFHKYTGMDNFREKTGYFSNDDQINFGLGFQFNGELMLNKTFSLNTPVGLAVGYRWQAITGGYTYSSAYMGKLTREVNITNNIAYFSAAFPLDSQKYCYLGALAGIGASTYELKWEWSDKKSGVTYSPDINKSAKGFVVPVGVFLDWGSDGIGGRLGAEYMFSKYSKIDGSKPNGNGYQIYLNLRYAI